VGEGRVAGAQFHPERSGAAGAEFLRAVLRWAGDAA
jgi:imidazoleglycerol phosphate synthase glutamine amidotransferase subunit HisH